MRSDRYKDNDNRNINEKKKRDSRTWKRFPILLILVLIAGVTAEVAVLLSLTGIDSRFSRDVERGLRAGWDLESNEFLLQQTGRITDTGFIDAEFEAIADYTQKTYKDDELGRLANEYIKALKDCKKAAEGFSPETDYKSFWAAFSAPYVRRVKALYKMQEGGFILSADNREDLSDEALMLLAQGWLLNEISGLRFTPPGSGRTGTYTAQFTNESGMDIEYLNLDISLTDNDNKVLETASAYVSDVPAGESASLSFICTSRKATHYRIISQACRFAKPAPAEEEADGDDEAIDNGSDAEPLSGGVMTSDP